MRKILSRAASACSWSSSNTNGQTVTSNAGFVSRPGYNSASSPATWRESLSEQPSSPYSAGRPDRRYPWSASTSEICRRAPCRALCGVASSAGQSPPASPSFSPAALLADALRAEAGATRCPDRPGRPVEQIILPHVGELSINPDAGAHFSLRSVRPRRLIADRAIAVR